MNAEDILSQVRIAKPCPASWDEMEGDMRVRFCLHCNKNVYNLSAMNSDDAAALIRAKEGKLCARMYLRCDGTLLTGDCPVGVSRYERRVAWAVGLSMVMAAAVFGIPMTRQMISNHIEWRILQVKMIFGYQPPTGATGGIVAPPVW